MPRHVLIIEDEPLVAQDLEAMLLKCGATSVSFAETEEEAVTEAAHTRPDLIASDVRLRSGSGPRAVELITQTMGPIPVIFITGNQDFRADSGSVARVLTKPVHERALAQAFNEADREHRERS